jgi:DNA-binding HxlR family transcriptional regulator
MLEKYTKLCPMLITQDLVGGKWKLLILWYLKNDKLRFSELQRLLPDVTRKMLTQQLRALEKDLLVHRYVHPVVPPKVEYSLTKDGLALVPILKQMCDWGEQYYDNHS